jgi:6-pyruvoyltetrahydropterin/6-carboxytetrahydropterin synthase
MFEAAHAIHQYPGSCASIHGHSYKLQVTVQAVQQIDDFIPGLGIIIDFKELKKRVEEEVIKNYDHKLILSRAYLADMRFEFPKDQIVLLNVEPSAENLLILLRNQIINALPEYVRLRSLKLWETVNSYVEWST